MDQVYLAELPNLYQALEQERPRLVRLCHSWLGDAAAAEDVVQETLLEAWRSIEKLRDPQAFRGWLFGIAHNLCLRWQRSQGRALSSLQTYRETTDILSATSSPFDFEVELDCADLAHLLEQALSLLPPDVRTVLIQKYIEDASHSAIADRLGISENVVAVRLHRGKLALRKALTNELQSETAAFGLLTAGDTWQETRIWCTNCGRRRLVGRLSESEFILRCPACNSEPGSFHSQTDGRRLLTPPSRLSARPSSSSLY